MSRASVMAMEQRSCGKTVVAQASPPAGCGGVLPPHNLPNTETMREPARDDLCRRVHYPLMNPVNAGLCAKPQLWPWSSGHMAKQLWRRRPRLRVAAASRRHILKHAPRQCVNPQAGTPAPPKNNKSRSDLAVRPGQMGDGSAPRSLSRASIWHPPQGVAGFPTPFSTASGVAGLMAGPSKASRPVDFE